MQTSSNSRFCAAALALVLLLASYDIRAQNGHWYVPFPDDFPHFRYLGTVIPISRDTQLLVGAIGQPDQYPTGLAVVMQHRFASSPGSQIVREFGAGGIVRYSVPNFLAQVGITASVRSDGKIVVVGSAIDPSWVGPCYIAFCSPHTVILRLNPDGSLDTSFNGTGNLVVHFGPTGPGQEQDETTPQGVMILANGDIALYGDQDPRPRGEDAQIGYVRTDGSVVDDFRAALGRIAWVFYNPHLGRYFLTADAAEIELLSRDGHLDWRGLLSGFRVYDRGANVPSSVPVCRFYDLQTQSHFISAIASECALISQQSGERWIYESDEVFRVVLPDPASGQCPVNQAPVYRLWNPVDGSHALTPDSVMRADLVADGFIPEGWGPDGVAMCGAP